MVASRSVIIVFSESDTIRTSQPNPSSINVPISQSKRRISPIFRFWLFDKETVIWEMILSFKSQLLEKYLILELKQTSKWMQKKRKSLCPKGSSHHGVTVKFFYLAGMEDEWYQGIPSNVLKMIDLNSGELLTVAQLQIPGSPVATIVSILPVPSATSYQFLVFVTDTPDNGNTYSFNLYGMTLKGTFTNNALASSVSNDTYTNFFWTDYNPNTNTAYLLAGDENDLYALPAVLYSFDINTGSVSFAQVDNSKFTISSFSVDRKTNMIYAVSGGLVNEQDAQTVVEINPVSGAVTPQFAVEPTSDYHLVHDYRGGVYSANNWEVFYHIFTTTAGDSVLYAIDIAAQTVAEIPIDLGVNAEWRIRTAWLQQ
eukprot:TRINITY_DN1507_c0_g1_i2.p1 TRINITY_DN1507_c0_g1~~TRINITY_DN1507_c0_g1_i2.p1  ORF type:complete len:370 (+),score=77.30 TRINITY_DN1507_c0_g1_i2:393-1502(+)